MRASSSTTHRRVIGSLWKAAAVLSVSYVLAGCGGTPSASTSTNKAVTGTYAFWPQFPDEPRVQFVRSFKSSEDVSQRQASGFEKLVFGREAEATDLINKPYGVAMRGGTIYICDIRNDCVMAMDLRKQQSRILGTSGAALLKQPVGIAIAEDGELYIADADQGSILVFDASERYSRVMGVPKFKPGGIAVFGDRVYATNLTGQNVQVFDRRSGEPSGTIGSVGDADGQFRLPLGIATDSKGNIWVTDMMRCRIQKFSPDGKLITAFGELGDYRGSFARPKHIAVDSEDIVYVVDAAFQNVQMFDGQNRSLMHFGSSGDFPGAMNLPAGICVCEDSVDVVADRVHPGFAPKRLIVVTNQFGGEKVALYAVGQLKSGYTAKDTAANSAKVGSGIDAAPSKERLKLQTPGDKEPTPDPAPGAAAPDQAAPATEKPK